MILKQFLEQRGYSAANVSSDVLSAHIKKVYWDGERYFDIVMETNEPPSSFGFFCELIEKKFPFATIKLSLSPLKRELFDVMKELSNLIPLSSAFGEVIIRDEVAEIPVMNKTLYDNIIEQGIPEKLAEIANQHGYTRTVSFFLKENIEDNFLERQQEIFNQKVKSLGEKIEQASHEKESNDKIQRICRKSALGKKEFRDINSIHVEDLNSDTPECAVEGKILSLKCRDLSTTKSKLEKTVVNIDLYDGTGTVACKMFIKNKDREDFFSKIKEGGYYRIAGKYLFDNWEKEFQISIMDISSIASKEKLDTAIKKRIELGVHTKMSQLDALIEPDDLFSRLKDWGHTSVGITDIDCVQAFPEIEKAAKKYEIKPIYGMDAFVTEQENRVLTDAVMGDTYDRYVVFDIETTGLSPQYDKITEIGAVYIENGQITNSFSELVNPERSIPRKIVSLTGISPEMVKDKPTIETVLPKFFEFCKGAILVAHNASFDTSFVFKAADDMGLDRKFPYIDTLALARVVLPELRRHRLDTLTKYFNVELENHHRAHDDALATAEVFLCLLQKAGYRPPYEINAGFNRQFDLSKLNRFTGYQTTIYAKDQEGIYNLYQLVSNSHLNGMFNRAKIDKSDLVKRREGLLIGSGGYASEVWNGILSVKTDDELLKMISFYDFIEVHPPSTLYHREDQDVPGEIKQYEQLTIRLIQLAIRARKPVIATGNVRYLDKEDAIVRMILFLGGKPRRFDDYAHSLYLRTTEEMLDEFRFLPKEVAEKIVIDNPKCLEELIEEVHVILPGTYSPVIEGSDEKLRSLCFDKAHEIYGENLPVIVSQRLEKELHSIITNGYSVLYMIAQKLVHRSNEDGYLVGSRGSVGSSFVATMAGITEVNPLPPHYICPNCKYSDFDTDESVHVGPDLADKVCPLCGHILEKAGYEIPFEVFLGFEGDKEPDIDLNFAGEYQTRAHKYTEDIFGKENVIRAGTIGTLSDKTAYGYIRNFCDQTGTNLSRGESDRMQRMIEGVKRTTGQHPGGIMIFPKDHPIHHFTALQYPADDPKSETITTHFSYKSISGHVLKLDLLGHDVPSIIRMLQDLTGVDPLTIPIGDKETMKIFKNDGTSLTALGIPEFGTDFVMGMLAATHPTTFAELIRISGLSHGTDVWLGNAQELINSGTTNLSGVIATRDDIMTYLIHRGVEKLTAFKTMESVRKGKGLTPEMEQAMIDQNIDSWYIDSCKKIKYMFPKAHAVAYVLMSYRIAYCKVHYPEAFYATFFSTKIDDFSPAILVGKESVEARILEIEENEQRTTKDEQELAVLYVAREMYERNISLAPLSFQTSHPCNFTLGEDDKIVPPLRALPNVSDSIARKISNEFKVSEFLSIEDLQNRTKANRNAIDALTDAGLLKGLSETNQLSFF